MKLLKKDKTADDVCKFVILWDHNCWSFSLMIAELRRETSV